MYLLGILCCGHSLKIVKLPDVFAARPSLNHSTQLGLEAGKIFFFLNLGLNPAKKSLQAKKSFKNSFKKSVQKLCQKIYHKFCPTNNPKNLSKFFFKKSIKKIFKKVCPKPHSKSWQKIFQKISNNPIRVYQAKNP